MSTSASLGESTGEKPSWFKIWAMPSESTVFFAQPKETM
jgi:hypothetical protein